jgi:hypothetical protein
MAQDEFSRDLSFAQEAVTASIVPGRAYEAANNHWLNRVDTSASHSMWTLTSKTFKARLHSSKYISNATKSEQLQTVADRSSLKQWRTPFVPLARCSWNWGPRTHA